MVEFLGLIGGFPCTTLELDRLAWGHHKDGVFSVNRLYNWGIKRSAGRSIGPWNKIWKSVAPAKVKCFTWLVARKKCLTHEAMQKRRINIVSRCLLCKEALETNKLLFMHFAGSKGEAAKIRKDGGEQFQHVSGGLYGKKGEFLKESSVQYRRSNGNFLEVASIALNAEEYKKLPVSKKKKHWSTVSFLEERGTPRPYSTILLETAWLTTAYRQSEYNSHSSNHKDTDGQLANSITLSGADYSDYLQYQAATRQSPLSGTSQNGLKELDLTGNLLSDWREIAAICKELPALVTLNLSYNIMSHDISGMPLLNHINVVVLNHTGIGWKQVEMLKDPIPLVEELHLMGNKLRGITPLSSDIVHGFDSLRLLNLENNFIAAWDEILKLSQLKRLEQLFLNNNCISHIWYPDHNPLSEPPNSHELLGESFRPFQNLRCLLVGGNKIEDFSSIDTLNLFPNLLDIRLSENPIVDPRKGGVPRFVLIARLAKVEILNGSQVSPRERKDSEIRYVRLVMSKCQDNPEEIKKLHPRFAELKKFHGIEDEKAATGATGPQKMSSSLISITLKCVAASIGEKVPLTKKLPATTTVGKLKILCESFFKIKSVKPKLFLQEEEAEVTEVDVVKNQLSVKTQEGDNDLLRRYLVGRFNGGDEVSTRNEFLFEFQSRKAEHIHMSGGVMKEMSDKCGGWLENEEETELKNHLRWARIRVKGPRETIQLSIDVDDGNLIFFCAHMGRVVGDVQEKRDSY
ncbi:hypothetical protein MTR67_048523 [Solanum verrucosum]|uniref:Reverse transcriptase zinc-binding domain-containing protein n=1 Tax=Solanum verrucosum TaxID=315347 RepID=A0AAF0V1M6_SOLVR|nr:hypothetical protein MTR67_048523 [Solanum verrucosum]